MLSPPRFSFTWHHDVHCCCQDRDDNEGAAGDDDGDYDGDDDDGDAGDDDGDDDDAVIDNYNNKKGLYSALFNINTAKKT